MDTDEIVADIEEIKRYRRRAALDRAWEMSNTRRFIISTFVYIIAALWLVALGDALALLKALVPAVGYFVSTLALPFIKRQWIYATYRPGRRRR